MSMLELRRVSKVYGQGTAGVHARADVSLPADEGPMVAVMGPSGSGKSTLARVRAAIPRSLSTQKQALRARSAPPTSRDAAMHTRQGGCTLGSKPITFCN